ncbi:hypothetical protein GGF32_006388 [Allomyces javanicus]|nr:hypothetical protein GGF32_006388 [Allomyces javanicus]
MPESVHDKLERGIAERNPTLIHEVVRVLTDAGDINKSIRGLTALCTLDPSRALSYLDTAFRLRQDDPVVLNNIAFVLHKDHGLYERAIDFYQNCLAVDPTFETAYLGILDVLHTLRLHRLESVYIHRGLTYCPDSPELLNVYGLHVMYGSDENRITQARTAFSSALATAPRSLNSKVYLNLGHLENVLGNVHQGIDHYLDAIECDPGNKLAFSNVLLNAHYLTQDGWGRLTTSFGIRRARTRSMLDALHTKVADQVFKPGDLPAVPADARSWASGGQSVLQVGFIGADFVAHAVSFFLDGFLKGLHGRPDVHISVFSNAMYDKASQDKIVCDAYHCIKDKSADHVATLIREARVHVLIDLSGHTSGHRLDVLALAPAPVMVTMIGYPNGTGQHNVLRVSDTYCDDNDARVLRLDRVFLCYSPPSSFAALVPKVHAGRGRILGCFGKLPKINSNLISLWARVLRTYPETRLVLKSRFFTDKTTLNAWRSRFKDVLDRVSFLPAAASQLDHMDLFRTIDVHLDTYPYSGTTITSESLYMNVPVLTYHRADDPHVSKVSGSILTALGLGQECIARSPDEYVDKVRYLLDNGETLHVRERMFKSPFVDVGDYTDSVLDALKTAIQH